MMTLHLSSHDDEASCTSRRVEQQMAKELAAPKPSPGGEAGLEFTLDEANKFFPMDVPAAWEYTALESDELTFTPGQVLRVIEPFEDEGWVVAQLAGRRGIAPTPYLTKMIFPSEVPPRSPVWSLTPSQPFAQS